MVKKQHLSFLVLLVFSLLFNELKSQEASFIFNRTSFSVFNPAFTGSEGSIVSFNRRSQWNNVEGAPRTNFLIYHMPKKNNVILGFTAQNDWAGTYDKTGELLPAGSYYYVVEVPETGKVKKGWLYLTY